MSRAGQPEGRLVGVIRRADRIDYWVRRRMHAADLIPPSVWPAPDHPHGSMRGASHSRSFPAGDRGIWLSIGDCLRARYDALAPPLPRRLAALVEQLETLNRVTMYAQKPHWLDYDPLALAVLVIGIGIVELLVMII
jgi:preprotein translocase subunit Sss1